MCELCTFPKSGHICIYFERKRIMVEIGLGQFADLGQMDQVGFSPGHC